MGWDGPILDNHLHVDPHDGAGLEAIKEFADAGGTHVLILNNPSWHRHAPVSERADFAVGFEETIEIADAASSILSGRAWPVLGVHPGLTSRLLEDRELSAADAREILRTGIDAAAERIAAGRALALKSGRPHYPVEDETWSVANEILRYAFERAAAVDCAVQQHTEEAAEFTVVGEWASAAGLDPDRVVKHYATEPTTGVVPSAIGRRDVLLEHANTDLVLMETDFLDDPDRPGAVLGPKTIPRRVRWLFEEGYTEFLETAHIQTPRAVYGIDLPDTLKT